MPMHTYKYNLKLQHLSHQHDYVPYAKAFGNLITFLVAIEHMWVAGRGGGD